MSSSHDHSASAAGHGYGGGGRSARPLFALIPIGLALAICVAMLAGGLHVMTTPSDPSAGVDHVAQTTAPGAPS
jgi:hypothetical protein